MRLGTAPAYTRGEGCRMAVGRAAQAKCRACAGGGLKENEREAPF